MTSEPKDNSTEKTRQEAREEKLRKKKARMKQHGKGLAKVYRDVITKRLRRK
jgi:hypothetical protein